jgi:chromate transporter
LLSRTPGAGSGGTGGDRRLPSVLPLSAPVLGTLAFLWRFKKFPEPYVVAAAGILGILLHR